MACNQKNYMSQIIGIQKSEGEFEGHPYSNYRIFTKEDFNPNAEGCIGNYVKTFTAKRELLDKWLAENKLSLSSLIGVKCKMYFDEHGKVSYIQLA